jgi:hypothetical protein
VEQRQERGEEFPENKSWLFVSIKDHKGQLLGCYPDYKESAFLSFDTGKIALVKFEPPDIMIKDDPVSVARYAEENGLLHT